MSIDTTKSLKPETPSIAHRVAQGARYAIHLSHEARAVKSLAEETIEDGVHAARRSVEKGMRRSIEMLEDLKDEGTMYVKRQPLKAVALVASVALMVGLGAGWTAAQFVSNRRRSE